jgi:hypothetical protein
MDGPTRLSERGAGSSRAPKDLVPVTVVVSWVRLAAAGLFPKDSLDSILLSVLLQSDIQRNSSVTQLKLNSEGTGLNPPDMVTFHEGRVRFSPSIVASLRDRHARHI